MTDISINQLPSDAAIQNWDALSLVLAKSVFAGEETLDAVMEKVADRRTQVWTVQDDDLVLAVAATEIVRYPFHRTCRLAYLGGIRMDEWFEKGIERWEQFAEDHSCDRMELVGRRGWLRAFKGLKFREKYVTLEKDLRARH